MAKKGGRGYFNLGLPKLVNVLIAIFGGWICGFITRLLRGRILGAIISLLLFPITWICDLVTCILSNDLKLLA